MSVGDIDDDGDPDIVVADKNGERVLAYENQAPPVDRVPPRPYDIRTSVTGFRRNKSFHRQPRSK